jgi:hypothetical protein
LVFDSLSGWRVVVCVSMLGAIPTFFRR